MNDNPPSIRAVRFPTEYGKTGSDSDRIAWDYVEEKLRGALNYWLSTVSPSGRPHARPVDGVWVEGALIFGGSPETRWARNLEANPALSVHLASETEAIILEGTAELVTDPAHPLIESSSAASLEKYPQYHTADMPEMSPVPFWLFRPDVVYAWSLEGFPRNATRWRFTRP